MLRECVGICGGLDAAAAAQVLSAVKRQKGKQPSVTEVHPLTLQFPWLHARLDKSIFLSVQGLREFCRCPMFALLLFKSHAHHAVALISRLLVHLVARYIVARLYVRRRS